MRQLCNAESPQDARRIVDGLLIDGIEAQLRPEDGTEVWVIDGGQMDAARRSMATRSATDATATRKKAQDIRRKKQRDDQAHGQRVVDVQTRWRGVSNLGVGPITLFLVLGSVVIALLGYMADDDAHPMWTLTIDHFASTQPLAEVRAGQWWRLLTPMFLHFGLFHLGFNMIWVWVLGPQVESNHGSLLLAALVIVAELVGNLGQYWASGPAFGGMSGVVYALFGFVWMSARYDRRYRYAHSERNTYFGIGRVVLCATGLVGPIANIGHAGGLVAGLAFGFPAYLRHVRARGPHTKPEAGSWADVNLQGFRKFRRTVLMPYAPLWLLLIAAGVIVAEYSNKQVTPIHTGLPSCDAYFGELQRCTPPGQGIDVHATFEMWAAEFHDGPQALELRCRILLEAPVCAVPGAKP